MTDSTTESKVKLPSIRELTIGLPAYEQQQEQQPTSQYHTRHPSIGSSSTSPQQLYYHVNSSQPSVILPQPSAALNGIISTNSSISSASSCSQDGLADPLTSRKSSIATSITPPYQSSSFPPTTNQGNYIISGNPQYDMLNYKIQQTHPVNPFEHITTSAYYQQPQYPGTQIHHQQHQRPHHHIHPHQHITHQHIPSSQPKKKRPRRKANEMERLYACNWKNCKNSYGTLNHLNAHITFKRHGPKRKPEEFKQIRELYKLKKTKLEKAKEDLVKDNKLKNSDANIELLANLSERFFDGEQNGGNGRGNVLHDGNGDVTELPIYHQQRGYNGYGRHSYTLKQGDEKDILVSGE